MTNNHTHSDSVKGQQEEAKRSAICRVVRPFFIVLVSLLLLVVLGLGTLLWGVFTPDRLTPFVYRQLEKHLPYHTQIGSVELTFFSTFPQFGIRIDDVAVINHFPGAPSDTLASVKQMVLVFDARALWRDNEVIIEGLFLTDAQINLFTDSLGQSNFQLLLTESEDGETTTEGLDIPFVDLRRIEFNNLNFSYTDQMAGLGTSISGIETKFSGILKDGLLKGMLEVDRAGLSFAYAGESYLDGAEVAISLPAEIRLADQQVHIQDAFFSLNGLGIDLDGLLQYDAESGRLFVDMDYRGHSWPAEELVSLVPPDYLSDLGEFEIKGAVLVSGEIRGVLQDSILPVVKLHVSINQGELTHEYLPFMLSRISAEMDLAADLNEPSGAVIDIGLLEARSPSSQIKTRGRINDLLGDIRLRLVSDANICFEELGTFIPADMPLKMQGRLKGRFNSVFTLSQLMGFELENMKISGSPVLSDLFMLYDSLSIYSNNTAINFSIPNTDIAAESTRFARVEILSDTLGIAVADSISGSLTGVSVQIALSDIREPTAIPEVTGAFHFNTLKAQMDTIGIISDRTSCTFSVSSLTGSGDRTLFNLEYDSEHIQAAAGREIAMIGKVNLKTQIVNDNAQNDFFSKWLAKGFLTLDDAVINVSVLPYTFEIPLVKMDLNPDTFRIHESNFRLDDSDFALAGSLQNVLPYFRGDSLLRGTFEFKSNHTNLLKIMGLTNGLGDDGDADDQVSPGADEEQSRTDTLSGPYMVPKGIDVTLQTDIRTAVYGPDTITNIRGAVNVSDGILVLDGVHFNTPAADMQLTAMYRTPRKNHLYLGVDYHMFDVDISRLLQMIPDIDTLMPMLRSFRGKGEFHMAVETYLDSLYRIKKSTLRGASSIRGQDLVLMDGETFSEIAKSLRFSKKAENRVDSLSAEFTIFREEIDIYPFLVVMDRYRAVVAGRHNFDMSFDYHISLVDSPLPIRLGVDVRGTLDDMQYRVTNARYAELYRPVARRVVESRQLELRNLIRETLLQNVSD